MKDKTPAEILRDCGLFGGIQKEGRCQYCAGTGTGAVSHYGEMTQECIVCAGSGRLNDLIPFKIPDVNTVHEILEKMGCTLGYLFPDVPEEKPSMDCFNQGFWELQWFDYREEKTDSPYPIIEGEKLSDRLQHVLSIFVTSHKDELAKVLAGMGSV